MNEIKNVNVYEETNNEGQTKEIELTPAQQLKCTIKDAKNKILIGLNDAIVWCVNNPKKAVGIAGGLLAGYNTVVRPIMRDISEFKAAHTYEFYDAKNHEPLTLRRKLTDREHKELMMYMNDRTEWHFASDWLRKRNLLK